MLGRFLELSVAAPDIGESLEFYAKLGFSQAPVNEAWPHAYAVVTDGRIHLGLHGEAPAAATLTFVKPDLLKFLDTLRPWVSNFEFLRLGGDVFNEAGWRSPCGHLLRLVEARTFSPGERPAGEPSHCGYFLEVGLPCADAPQAKRYWEDLGFVGMDEADGSLPHVSCTSDTIDIGLYSPAQLARPALLFDAGDLAATQRRLAQVGINPSGPIGTVPGMPPAALRRAPQGALLGVVAGAGAP